MAHGGKRRRGGRWLCGFVGFWEGERSVCLVFEGLGLPLFLLMTFLLTGSLATREKTVFFENYARACQCFVMVRS